MYALNIRQPYAWAIAEGAKTIEWRSWKWSYRGELLIVASARPAIHLTDGRPLPAGMTVAVVELVDCRPFTAADMEPAMMEGFPMPEPAGYAFVLAKPRQVEAIKVRGQVRPWLWQGPEPIYTESNTAAYWGRLGLDTSSPLTS